MNTLQQDTLLALHAAADHGLPVANLLADLRRGRHRSLTLPQLESALRGLADKTFATPFKSALDDERWRITGRGTSALEEAALV